MPSPESRNTTIIRILNRRAAIITGDHFVYTNGEHGSDYINKDAIYPHVKDTHKLCNFMAQDYREDGVEVVVGAAMGAIILAHATAGVMSRLNRREVLGFFAEKRAEPNEKEFEFKRGYQELLEGRRALVVEDILNTGGSARRIVELCKSLGAEVVGVAAIANRGAVTSADVDNVPIKALVDVKMARVPEWDCHLCAAQIPVNTKIGKGAEFLRTRLSQ